MKKRQIQIALASSVVVATALVKSCGGKEETAGQVKMVSIQPPDGAVEVPTDAKVVVEFSEPVPSGLETGDGRGGLRTEKKTGPPNTYFAVTDGRSGGVVGLAWSLGVVDSTGRKIQFNLHSGGVYLLPYESEIYGDIVGEMGDGRRFGSGRFRIKTVAPSSVTASMATARAVTDGLNVYLVGSQQPETGTIRKLPLSGGAPSNLVSGRERISLLATDGASVYWGEATSKIYKISVNGGDVSKLAEMDSKLGEISLEALVPLGSDLFYFVEGVEGGACNTVTQKCVGGHTLKIVASAGGTPSKVASMAIETVSSSKYGKIYGMFADQGSKDLYFCRSETANSGAALFSIRVREGDAKYGQFVQIADLGESTCPEFKLKDGRIFLAKPGDFVISQVGTSGGEVTDTAVVYTVAPDPAISPSAASGGTSSKIPQGMKAVPFDVFDVERTGISGDFDFWVARDLVVFVPYGTDAEPHQYGIVRASLPKGPSALMIWTDAKKVYYLDKTDGTVRFFDK